MSLAGALRTVSHQCAVGAILEELTDKGRDLLVYIALARVRFERYIALGSFEIDHMHRGCLVLVRDL